MRKGLINSGGRGGNFYCKILGDASFMTIAVDLIEDGTRILDSMKIKVVSRRYFEKLKGSPELAGVISSHRIVSIGL